MEDDEFTELYAMVKRCAPDVDKHLLLAIVGELRGLRKDIVILNESVDNQLNALYEMVNNK